MKHDVARFEKHVNEDAAVLAVPWANYLSQTGLTISTSSWTNQTPGGGSVTLSNDGLAESSTVTFVMLDGGVDGGREYLENRVVFSDGSDAVYTVIIDVVDKIP